MTTSTPQWAPTPAQVEASKRRELASGVITGALMIAARFIVPALPLFSGHSLNEANGYCTGAVGLLVRGLGGAQANAACDRVGHWMLALNVGALAGAVLAITCGAFLIAHTQRTQATS